MVYIDLPNTFKFIIEVKYKLYHTVPYKTNEVLKYMIVFSYYLVNTKRLKIKYDMFNQRDKTNISTIIIKR